MASGGTSGRGPSVSRSFDFGSDDVLCSYDDLGGQDVANGRRLESSGKEFRENRMGRPLVDVYSSQEEHDIRDLIPAVEKCMKKYADNLLRSFEGLSGRLTQLELYCYNIERSIGDLRSDLCRDQNESELKLKSLEKHVQEVHRSVQILRDKQELAETQKELTKLQLAQKESSGGAATMTPEPKKPVESNDPSNQQLALVPKLAIPSNPQSLPYKELPLHQPVPSSQSLQQESYAHAQGAAFYSQQNPMVNQMQPQQQQQSTALQTEQHYATQSQRAQPQDPRLQHPQQPLAITHQVPQHHPLPQYEQTWTQVTQQPSPQISQQVVQPQRGPQQAHIRPETPAFSPYHPSQPASSLPEVYPGSMPMQVPYMTTVPQSGGNRQGTESFSYGVPGSTVPLPPAPQALQRQQIPMPASPQVDKSGYPGAVPYTQHSSVQGYATHGGDAGRTSHFVPGSSYPPASMPSGQTQQPPGVHPGVQTMRTHPYAELVEKAVSMGYARDHVVSVIRRLEDGRMPVDFNSVLDLLNARPTGPPPRGWSA